MNQNQSTQILNQLAVDEQENPGLIGIENNRSVFVTNEAQDTTGDMPVETPELQDMSSAVGHAPEPDDADDLDATAAATGLYAEPGEERQELDIAEEVAEAEQAVRNQQPA